MEELPCEGEGKAPRRRADERERVSSHGSLYLWAVLFSCAVEYIYILKDVPEQKYDVIREKKIPSAGPNQALAFSHFVSIN